METLVKFLEAELVRRSWRQADLARAARVPDATIHHILNGSRRAGPEVCNALARALASAAARGRGGARGGAPDARHDA